MRNAALLLVLTALCWPADQPLPLTLNEVLRLAHNQGRQTITRLEDLRLEELALAKVRGDFGPRPSASVSTAWSGVGHDGRPQQTQTANAAVSQSVPGGGTVTVSGQAARDLAPTDDHGTGSGRASVAIEQPLLRGAGLAEWREPLTQAERSRRYRLRDFELFRQGLTVDTATRFWGLQRQRAAVIQTRESVAQAEFTWQQSQALMAIGKSNANDVFRAETNLLGVRQAVVDAEASFAADCDNFKLDLALDGAAPIAIDASPPGLVRQRIDPAAAAATALERRLDLQSTREQVEDIARALTRADRDLLPNLRATGSSGWNGALGTGPAWERDPAWQVALTLDIPLDQRAERLALERARTTHLRSLRDESLLRERIVSEVRDAIRRLRAAETTLLIQDRNRVQAARRLEKAQLDMKAGIISNRDVVEAQNEVRSSEDAWFGAMVSYNVAELGLRRATGTLVIKEDGSWDPALPFYALPLEVK